MTAIHKKRFALALGIPLLIFAACAGITFTRQFKEHPDLLSLAILGDLLIIAPALYFLVIRKSSLSKFTVLRVFMAGLLVATVLLSKNNSQVLNQIKVWVAPLAEIVLMGFIVWKFYSANKQLKSAGESPDFLIHCRAVLKSVFGSEKLANALASEVSVFYYTFCRKDRSIDYKTKFTSYKQSGILVVLGTLLVLFLLETTGVHFLLLRWNKTMAWIFSSLSLYSCLQLFAHIRALKSRPVVLTEKQLLLRNGLLGGDVMIPPGLIEKIEISKKLPADGNAVSLAFIKGLEGHNLVMYLSQPVTIIKAFGIKRTGKVLLVNIDKQILFVEAVKELKNTFGLDNYHFIGPH